MAINQVIPSACPDANTVAIGAIYNDGKPKYDRVRIYSWEIYWIQKGLVDGEFF